MEGIVRVFLVDGSAKAVRYDEQTTVDRVTKVVLKGIDISQVAHAHFALRLIAGPSPTTAGTGDSLWLHPLMRISQLHHIYSRNIPIGVSEELKLELRVRYLPESVFELKVTDLKAFIFLHEQVSEEFFQHVAWKTPIDTALEIASLKICREFSEAKAKGGPAHLEDIDIEGCLQSLLPNILCHPTVKPSTIKKQFFQLAKKNQLLPMVESIIRSFALLLQLIKFDVEFFKAALGIGYSNPVELVVGPHVGLSYRVNDRCETSKLLELRTITEISLRKMENSSEKTLVQLKLSGAAQPVIITVANDEMGQSLAHLLDGYQMMYNQKDSVYKIRGIERCETMEMKAATGRRKTPTVEFEIRLRRENITLKDLLGGGQFGNVYRAIYYNEEKDEREAVAVKVCKLEAEPADTQLILQESCLMRNFRHAHIISLIGVCTEQPIWLVMELAEHGELREYLQQEKEWLSLKVLLLYCTQLSSALKYLHANRFVHRDIAARNVLVSSPQCVKLADFGLSRALDYDAIYTASRGKLPIKWLAPESVNYRQFSMASDVWMFGVCMWEILSIGVKPWIGIPNADVITHIEQGIRPECPEKCPDQLFQYIKSQIWAFEPHKRPTMEQVFLVVEDVHEQVSGNIPKEEVRVNKPTNGAGVIITEMSHLPSLTLFRTLEEQRRQAEEDGKWLDDDDNDELDQLDEEVAASSIVEVAPPARRSSTTSSAFQTLQKRPEDVASREMRKSVEKVCDGVSRLQNSFNNLMNNDEFLLAIKNITGSLREMFAMSSQLMCRVENGAQRTEVELTETLIANDMKQMSRVMGKLHVNKQDYNLNRRDVVRICGELAVNCNTLLIQLTSSPSDSEFRTILSNC